MHPVAHGSPCRRARKTSDRTGTRSHENSQNWHNHDSVRSTVNPKINNQKVGQLRNWTTHIINSDFINLFSPGGSLIWKNVSKKFIVIHVAVEVCVLDDIGTMVEIVGEAGLRINKRQWSVSYQQLWWLVHVTIASNDQIHHPRKNTPDQIP